MRLELVTQKAFLSNVNVRAEIHGTEKEPAADLKFKIDVQNQKLSVFDPNLLPALYFFDEGNANNDLASKGTSLPNRRLTLLPKVLKLDSEMLGGKLTIHRGLGGVGSDIVLPDIKVKEVSIEPKEGGTVEITFQVQCHPDESQFGKVGVLVQQELEITIEAPGDAEPPQGNLLGAGQA